MKHPFKPFILQNSKNMIIGTLPPDNIEYYYSNSANTRMWDLLKSIKEKTEIPRNSYLISKDDKQNLLTNLNLSMTDIILEYKREKDSTADKDIIPIKYNNIENIINNTSITNLLFVYKSALQWFLHSLDKKAPIKLSKLPPLKNKEYDVIHTILLNQKSVNCILLPNPLNRGRKGQTLEVKKEIYKKYIEH